uniref:Lipid droplet-associated hydrolase n=1 Tax=Graphocephala atropunctata TaxID=36148 RepID=A0A1B6LBZ0_9HEMI
MAHREGWVVVNQVPTRVQTWGGWIEDPLPDGDSVVVCIPGNPGLTSFYSTFLASLHQQLGIPVWICCQAGHELPPLSTRLTCPNDPSLYTTMGQAAHKAAFLQQYLPANRKLYLIGHSLGAKLVSELLRNDLIARHTLKCYLLMPTLERIAQTPNGKFLTTLLDLFMTVIIFLAWIFSLFPTGTRVFLIRCWFILSRQHEVDRGCMEATCQLTRPRQLRNIFTLALNEMVYIRELDMQVLNAHCAKLKVYFARKDGWAPLSYMESLKKAKPEIDVTVLAEQFQHAFVLDNPEEMADILAQEIKKERAK